MLHPLRCDDGVELDQMRELVSNVRGVDIDVLSGTNICSEGAVNCGRVQVQGEHSRHLVMTCAQVRFMTKCFMTVSHLLSRLPH